MITTLPRTNQPPSGGQSYAEQAAIYDPENPVCQEDFDALLASRLTRVFKQ
ncbi:MAG: hypothetical protein AAGE59_21750 [Cyanobacteria bacterium P01_F01_bin.86]